MTAAEFPPARALVRPRVRRSGSALPRLLEEEVAELLTLGKRVDVRLVGTRGCGLTTALRHLAAVFAGDPRLWVSESHTAAAPSEALVRVRNRHGLAIADLDFELLPWTDDDVLEYLLAAHRETIGPAFTAWRRGPEHDLGRHPGVCRSVLDALAMAPELGEPRTALAKVLREHLGPKHAALADRALRLFVPPPTRSVPGTADRAAHLVELQRAVGSTTAIGQLAAGRLLELASQQDRRLRVELRWSPSLRSGVEHALRTAPDLAAMLRGLADQPRLRHKALVLGSLCIHERGFRPARPLHGNLPHAWLHGIDLSSRYVRARLAHAELDHASLREAHVDRCDLTQASLRRANAERCQWTRLNAPGLRAEALVGPSSCWPEAMLRGADFRGADLAAAAFPAACLDRANLQGTSLPNADLRRASLGYARLDQADLTGARCEDAHFESVDLRTTKLVGAECRSTWFVRCDLSGTDLPGLSAPHAVFRGSDLTGARWRGARLTGASFATAGLADVDWEGADLRGCDLRRATFHLGNSRSGLVDSPIASEGSRTGFYTDESLEQQFQAPEAVRKANLRGCDLRGARLDGTDFYLVDVRGARLDAEQRAWMQRCRAILDRR